MSRALFVCAAALILSAGSTAAHAGPNFEAVSVVAAPNAVAGSGLDLIVTVRIDPGQSTTFTPYLTSRGVVAGALALAPVAVPQPPSGRTVRIETSVPVPSNVSGVFTVALALDDANLIAEDNELDNVVAATSVTRIRAQQADLQVASVLSQQARRRPNDPIDVDVTVNNAGEVAATIDLAAFVSRGPEVTPDDVEVARQSVTVPAQGQVSTTLSGRVPAELAAGSYALGVIADPAGQVADFELGNNLALAAAPVVVYFDTLSLDTQSLPGATLTQLFFVAMQATGGDGAYDFSVSAGELPDGLSLSPDGELSGVPSRSGSFDFTIQVASDGKTDARAFSVDVVRSNAILTIATDELTSGFLNMPYEQLLLAGGGEAPYNWDLVEGEGFLPPGLDLSPAGLITGVPNTLGTFNFQVRVDDRLGNRDQRPLRIVVTSATNIIILVQRTPPLPVGEPVDLPVVAAGGVQPYTWKAISPTPPGLSLSEVGQLVGTPTQVGRWPVWVQVTDGSRAAVTDTSLIQVDVVNAGDFEIDLLELPRSTVRSSYEAVISARGGEPPLKWSMATGSFLPNDFFLVPGDGVDAPENTAFLYGFPIVDGVHGFTVRVEDAFGRTREMTYALSVDPVVVDVASSCRNLMGSDGGTDWALALLFLGLLRVRRRRP